MTADPAPEPAADSAPEPAAELAPDPSSDPALDVTVEGSPRKIGRYRLGSLLGRGGMGEVYRAHDERLRRDVAVKRVRPVDGDPAPRRARLEREAQLLAGLGHPAIVQVFDILEDDDGDWVVMELVEGSSLAALLEDGAMSVRDSVRHGVEIARALEVAHQRGIVHRDLKVENVMLSAAGQIKILDFGIAKRVQAMSAALGASLSVEGQVMGTVRAMSPEQARGLPVDARSDLFSLGVLLYELLAASSPFAGQTAMDTLLRVSVHRQTSLAELPLLRSTLPPALSELVDQLLEKAPEHRPRSAAALGLGPRKDPPLVHLTFGPAPTNAISRCREIRYTVAYHLSRSPRFR